MADQDYLIAHFQREEARFEIGKCVCNAPVYAGVTTLPKELYIHCDSTGKHFWYDVQLADHIATLGPRKKPVTTKTLLTARITSLLDFLAQHAAEKQVTELIVVDKPVTAGDTGIPSYEDGGREDAPGMNSSGLGKDNNNKMGKDKDKDNNNKGKDNSEQDRRGSPRLAAIAGIAANSSDGGQRLILPLEQNTAASTSVVLANPERAVVLANPERAVVVANTQRPIDAGQDLLEHANFERAMTLSSKGTRSMGLVEIYLSHHRNHGAFNILQISKSLLMVFGPLAAMQLFSAWHQRNGIGMWNSLLQGIPDFLPGWLRESIDTQTVERLTTQLNFQHVNEMMLDIEAVHGYRMASVVELPSLDSTVVRAQRALANVLSASKTC